MAHVIIRIQATIDNQGVMMYYVPDLSDKDQKMKQVLVHGHVDLRRDYQTVIPTVDLRIDAMELLTTLEKLIRDQI